MKSQNVSSVRASISFPPDLYEALEGIAKVKKASLAWVLRDAAELYVANETKDGSIGRHNDRITPALCDLSRTLAAIASTTSYASRLPRRRRLTDRPVVF